MCSAFFIASVGQSEARPGQSSKRHAQGHYAKHDGHNKHGYKSRRHSRSHARATRHRARVAVQTTENASTHGAQMSSLATPSLVAEARRYIGRGNPTGRATLWCARFMNMVLARTGRPGTGSDMARSFASYGKRVSGPQVGAIAVMSRGKRGGHVGVVSGVDKSGNPIVVSGNYGRRVAEAVFSRSRIYAYVVPTT